MSVKIRCWMFHNVAGLWTQPSMFRLTDTECNALFFFNGSQHCWLLNAARYTKADGVFLSYGLNISAVCWTQPGCICGKCRGCSPTERRPLPPERHRKSEMVREEVVLVVQEEIVSALLLFRVLRDRDDRSVSVSIKLYQQVLTATIKENVQCW